MREYFPDRRECGPLRLAAGYRHRCPIATTTRAQLRAWSSRRYPAWAAAAVLLVTVAGVIVTTVELVQTPTAPDDYRNGALIAICYAVPYAVTGAFLVARRPDLPFGWLLAAAAVLAAVGTAADAMIYVTVSHGASQRLAFVVYALSITQLLPTAVQGLVNVRFPSGRLSSRRARVLEIALITGIVLGFAAGLLGDQTLPLARPDGSVDQVSNPLTHGTLVGRIADDLSVVVPVVILLGLIAGLGVVRRAWKATGIERYQLRWRAYGVVFSLLGFPFAVFTNAIPVVIDLLDGLLFVVTLAIPVVWYRLWAIDTVIRRSAAYALVTIAVAGMFALIAAAGTAVASQRTGFIVGAAVACVMFAPALGFSQRLVDRLFYGHRNDPYRALSDLGRRLAAVAVPGEVLPAVVTGVAESLRLPYVAIERPADGSVLAAYGEPGAPAPAGPAPAGPAPASTERWPLSYQGVTVGTLVARPRRGEQSFDSRDRAVLGDIARQAGAAVHAQALTADLLDSRQRLVSAREEERRRLRRDLHDGLGPLLTSVGLNIDAARVHAERDGAGPDAENQDLGVLLGRAKEGAAQAIADLRGIVYGLRPSSLDDLGLAGAIAAHIRRLGEGTGMRVTLQAGQLADLPAAVEVAGFRIAVEALNNAVRHSTARNCQVRLEIDTPAQLLVEVRDDGTSDGPWPAGVGLQAMRERAAELGGTLIAGPSASGGLVRGCLPVPVRAAS
jgi:two-component system, NarL family, sensor kinase